MSHSRRRAAAELQKWFKDLLPVIEAGAAGFTVERECHGKWEPLDIRMLVGAVSYRIRPDIPCEYCGRDANVFGSTTFDNGVEHLEFCSNECMEDWQERDFDRRAERAHERSMQ